MLQLAQEAATLLVLSRSCPWWRMRPRDAHILNVLGSLSMLIRESSRDAEYGLEQGLCMLSHACTVTLQHKSHVTLPVGKQGTVEVSLMPWLATVANQLCKDLHCCKSTTCKLHVPRVHTCLIPVLSAS